MPRKNMKKGGNNNVYINELINSIRIRSRQDIRNIEAQINNIVERGINIDTRYSSGNTPLMVAANSGNKDIIEILVNKGANVNLKDGMNRTVLMTAIDSGEIRYLEEFENEKNRRFEIVKFLIDKGADVNVKSGLSGITPLIRLSQINDTDTLKLLLEEGANVNDKDIEFGRTPLFYAIENKKVENVKFLLDKDADIYIRDRLGNTPLEYAENLLAIEEDISRRFDDSEDESDGIRKIKGNLKKIIRLIRGAIGLKKLTAMKHSPNVRNLGLYDAMSAYYRDHPDEMEGGKKKRVYKKKEEENIFKTISNSFKKLFKF